MENFTNYLCGFLVNNPMALVLRVLYVAVWRICAKRLAILTFGLKHSTYLLAGVLGVPFVNNVEEWRKIAVLLIGAVDAVINGNEADVGAGKENFGIIADLKIIAPKAAHVLHNDGADAAFLSKRYQALPVRTVKVRAAVLVINKKLCVAVAVVVSVLLEYSLLVLNTVTVTLQLVIA